MIHLTKPTPIHNNQSGKDVPESKEESTPEKSENTLQPKTKILRNDGEKEELPDSSKPFDTKIKEVTPVVIIPVSHIFQTYNIDTHIIINDLHLQIKTHFTLQLL